MLVTDLDHVDSSDLVLDDLPSLLRKTRGVVISQEMALQLVWTRPLEPPTAAKVFSKRSK